MFQNIVNIIIITGSMKVNSWTYQTDISEVK